METLPGAAGAGTAPTVQCPKRPGHLRGCWLPRAVAALLLGALLPLSTASAFRGGTGGTPTPVVPSGRPGPVTITWVISNPAHPGLMYAGGYLGTPVLCVRESMVGCTLWAARSTDAGTRWTPLHPDDTYVPRPYQLAGYQDFGMPPPLCLSLRNPFLVAPNGNDLYYAFSGACAGDNFSVGYGLQSRDRGNTWHEINDHTYPDGNSYAIYNGTLAISPIVAGRLYAGVQIYAPGDFGYAIFVARADDDGRTWRLVTRDIDTIDGQQVGIPNVSSLLADSVDPNTVYMGLPGAVPSEITEWARSEDGGATWHLISPPIKRAFSPFQIFIDRHLPHAIVAQITGDGIPADRRYLSTDHGRTWKAIRCPGDWRDQCPAFTLDDAFGRGHAYGFYRDGVRAFIGGGPAGPRLPLSLHLPCNLSTLIDVAGGGKAALLLCQDPKMALATGPNVVPGLRNNPNLSGLLYRSANAGRSWQRVTPEISPPIPTAVPIQ